MFKEEYPEPKLVLKMADAQLRKVGLSMQNAGYIKNIARFSLEKSLDYKNLKTKKDEELIEYLVEIKGVGRWAVEMILMFNLNRLDIFPKDDLGIQNGMKALCSIQHSNKKDLFSEMEGLAENWRP